MPDDNNDTAILQKELNDQINAHRENLEKLRRYQTHRATFLNNSKNRYQEILVTCRAIARNNLIIIASYSFAALMTSFSLSYFQQGDAFYINVFALSVMVFFIIKNMQQYMKSRRLLQMTTIDIDNLDRQITMLHEQMQEPFEIE